MTTHELVSTIHRLLPDDPERERYIHLRRLYSDRRYIPSYHFTSPGGYLNDPCGLCFFKGVWHLFYQFVPEDTELLGWGHAVSVDLIHWEDLPAAIMPSFEDCCGSGGTLVEENRVLACYQGNLKGNTSGAIHIAASSDELLLGWDKLSFRPAVSTLDDSGRPNPYIAFDPFMWKDNGRYYLISAGGGSLPHPVTSVDYRRYHLFESFDLKNWHYLHDFLEGDRFCRLGDDGACPYFLPFGDRHILLHFSHMSGGMYIIGRYDRERMIFTAEDGGSFNSNSWMAGGVHAPSAFPDGSGGATAVFNINYGYSDGPENQIMSLPRTIRPGKEGGLSVAPAGDYASLRGKRIASSLELPPNREVILDGVKGRCLELSLTADTTLKNERQSSFFVPPNLLPVLELRVLRSSDAREYTSILFYRNRSHICWAQFVSHSWSGGSDSVLVVDAAHSTLSPDVSIHPPESARLYLAPDEAIDLHVFIDKSVVEVFAGDRACISMRVYPTLEDSTGVSVISRGVPCELSYEAWELGSAFDTDTE